MAPLAPEMLGLVQAVTAYEVLAIEAARTGDRRVALRALLANPLVRQWELADPLLDAILDANRALLPQFRRVPWSTWQRGRESREVGSAPRARLVETPPGAVLGRRRRKAQAYAGSWCEQSFFRREAPGSYGASTHLAAERAAVGLSYRRVGSVARCTNRKPDAVSDEPSTSTAPAASTSS